MMLCKLHVPWMRGVAWGLCVIGLVATTAAPAWADAKRTPFAGTETIVGGTDPVIIPAGDKFHVLITQFALETASDPRVSGNSTIVANAVWDLPAMLGPMWGTYRLENADGEWNGHWVGSRTLNEDGDVVSWVVATCVGSGAYRGLLARWTLTGLNVGPANPYLSTEGFIVEATRGRVDLPMNWRATRTETLNVATLDFEIVSETGVGTHIGRASNGGGGFLVPTSETGGLVTGMGLLTLPTGELIYWVVSGDVDFTGASGVSVSIFFTGGTGRFEDAFGQMNGTAFAEFGPPDADNIASATFSYAASGTIRY